MARPLRPLILNAKQQEILQTISRSREMPHGIVQRAHIIWAANSGDTNKTISQNRGLCEETVGFWRNRRVDNGAELEKYNDQPKQLREATGDLLADKPRPGSPGLFTAER